MLESFWGRHCYPPIVKRKLPLVTHFRAGKHGLHFRAGKHGLSEPSLVSITFSNWKTATIPHSLTREPISGKTYSKTATLNGLRREDTIHNKVANSQHCHCHSRSPPVNEMSLAFTFLIFSQPHEEDISNSVTNKKSRDHQNKEST